MRWMRVTILAFVFMIPSLLGAQPVIVNGKARNINNQNDFVGLMVVNKQSGQGKFAEAGGVFTVKCNKSDTLLVGARGYHTYEIVLADSADKSVYNLDILLVKLRVNLPEANVFAERELSEIRRDIEKLGYNQRDYMLSGVDAFNSPITFLYEQFSRREQQRRLAYQLINEQKRRDLLKELFVKYVNYDIIDLSPEQFDAFIDFIAVSDQFLQRTSQYDFIIFVKKKYQDFARLNDYR